MVAKLVTLSTRPQNLKKKKKKKKEKGDKASVWQMINEVVGNYRLHRELVGLGLGLGYGHSLIQRAGMIGLLEQ